MGKCNCSTGLTTVNSAA